jgi:hypothetical protein
LKNHFNITHPHPTPVYTQAFLIQYFHVYHANYRRYCLQN